MKSILCVFLILISSSLALAADTDNESTESVSRFSLPHANITAITYFQTSLPMTLASSYVETARVAWAPTYAFNSAMGLRGDLGVGFPKMDTGSIFFVGDAEALLTYRVMNSLSAELGGGAQLWTDTMNFTPVASAGLVHPFNSKLFGVFSNVRAEYTMAFTPALPTHQVEIGLGI